MKNLFYLLFAVSLFAVSCSSSNDDPEPNAPTTFTFIQNEINEQPNVVIGYYTEDGKCNKLAELGTLKKGIASAEITVMDKTIKNIYI